MYANSLIHKHHSEVIKILPLTGYYNNCSRINVGWYPVFNKNVENHHPQHKPGYLHSLPLFYTSFILKSERAHIEESHPGEGTLQNTELPPKNNTKCSF